MGDIKAVYGPHNEVPTGFREITEEEFSKSYFFHYTPEEHEFRQFVIPDPEGKHRYGNCVKGVHLYRFFDGTGIALVSEYWEGKVRYFKFGCQHDYSVTLSPEECRSRNIPHYGNCYHVYECSKCKHVLAQDSSD